MASQTGKTLSQKPEGTSYMDSPETIVVANKKIACDGGGGALGHPKVWYDMSESDFVECKYCDRIFALKGGSRDPQK